MKPKEILHEYLYLNPVDLSEQPVSKRVLDHLLSPEILLREYNGEAKMYFLESSRTIRVPFGYFKIFRSLDVLHGEELLYTETEGLDTLDLFIVGLEKFIRLIDTTQGCVSESIDLFLVLCRVGTEGIRKFLETEISIDLGPWIFDEAGKTLKL